MRLTRERRKGAGTNPPSHQSLSVEAPEKSRGPFVFGSPWRLVKLCHMTRANGEKDKT